MSKIKVGIIGVGSIAKEHIESYIKNEAVELYAFCDINETQLKKMGDAYGITRLYNDKDEMLSVLPELDAVSVCTWNSAHAECAIAALNAGCDVICEKPMATSAEDAEKMLAAAEKNKKLLMIGFVRRFGNDCKILKDFVDVNFFGELYYTKATYLRRNGSPGGWFGDKSRSAGGPLIDLGVHIIDFTRYILGNPKPVSVYGATFHKLANRANLKKTKQTYQSVSRSDADIFDVEDLATAMIRYDNGAVVSIETSFSLNIEQPKGDIEFFGTKAGAKLSPELEIFSDLNGYMINSTFDIETALSFDDLFANEINHFVDCVTNKTECISPASDGITIMNILDAIYKSAETGHEVLI